MCIEEKSRENGATPTSFFFSFSKWGLDCCWLTPHLWEYDGQTYSLHQAVRLRKTYTYHMQFLLEFKRLFIHYYDATSHDKCVHIFQSFAFIFGGLKCTETFFQWFMPNLYYFSAIRIPKMGRWRLWNQIPSLTFFPIFLQSKANKRYWIDIFFLWRLLWEWAVALVFLVSYCGRLLLLLYCGCKCGVFCVLNPPTLSLSEEALEHLRNEFLMT